MSKKYKIDNLDYNQISFIEQSLKRHIEYYNDLNIKRPNDNLYMKAFKTVSDLFKKVKEIRKSKGEKPTVQMNVVSQKEFDSYK